MDEEGQVAFFVPVRDQQILAICEMIPRSERPMQVVDQCCGEGLLAAAVLEIRPTAFVLALDGSKVMLEATDQRLAAFRGRCEAKLFDLRAKNWRRFSRPVTAFVSSLAVHHLDASKKQELFRDLCAMLAPGGSVVIGDVMLPASSLARAFAAREWDRAV